eukprot:Opistho-1_new@66383
MDDDLEAIRARRAAELRQGGGDEKAAAAKSQEDARAAMLSSILDQSARARLGRIASVKPEKARAVEELIIRMARTGQLGGKVDEAQLISLLEQVGGAEKKAATSIKFNRRKMDSDDEDLDM